MKDRSLLVLLFVTVAFIFYVNPIRKNISLMKTRLMVLDSQITAQESIKRQRADIGKSLKTTKTAASANEEYLFPAGKNASLALVDLQEFVKSTASSHHLEVLSSTWGEPVADPKNGLTTIPMSFMIKGVPADLDVFLQKLLYGNRFIRVERATITRALDQLLLNVSLVAFKRDDRHE